jgi:hypothetical protein
MTSLAIVPPQSLNTPVDGAEDGGGEAERRRLKSFLLFLQILCIAMARMD